MENETQRSTDGGYREARAGLLQPLGAHTCSLVTLHGVTLAVLWRNSSGRSLGSLTLGPSSCFALCTPVTPAAFPASNTQDSYCSTFPWQICLGSLLWTTIQCARSRLIWKEKDLPGVRIAKHEVIIISLDYNRQHIYVHLPCRCAEKQ